MIIKKPSESEAGRFSIEIYDTYVYLTVTEKSADPEITLKAILEQLNGMGTMDIDEASVNKALTVTDSPVVIGQRAARGASCSGYRLPGAILDIKT